MKGADRLLLKNGYDLKGNYTGERVQVLSERQKRKKWSKPYIHKRKNSEPSPSEKRIAKFLSDNKIRYIMEHYFRGCFNSKTNQLLYFDFYLPDYNAIIEFDGLHHFKAIYGYKKFKATQLGDWLKNRYCEKCGIPILRIKCFEANRIEDIICEWFDKNF